MGRAMDNYKSIIQWDIQNGRPCGSMTLAHKWQLFESILCTNRTPNSNTKTNIKAVSNQSKKKMNKQLQQVKIDIKEGCYSLKKVEEEERTSFRQKSIKRLMKKVQKLKGGSMKERMLCFFELGKVLGEEYTIGKKK